MAYVKSILMCLLLIGCATPDLSKYMTKQDLDKYLTHDQFRSKVYLYCSRAAEETAINLGLDYHTLMNECLGYWDYSGPIGN